jgi:hypothetical protein
MSEKATLSLELGGRTFEVPPLSIAHNIEAYPLLRKMQNSGFLERWLGVTKPSALDVESVEMSPAAPLTSEDMSDLTTVLFLCAKAAEPGLTVDEFNALPVTPAEMLAGWSVARFQSGGWVRQPAGEDQGETEGEPRPPTSTSAASSES